MLPLALWALLLLPIALLVNICLPLAKNVRLAKASGIPYVIVPFYAYNRLISLSLGRTLLRLVDRLSPEPSITSWRHLVTLHWPWKLRHAPFASLGTDTFLTVAPGGIIMHTADANVIAEIMARATDFPKPTHIYRHIEIYGKNVVSSEGAMWRRHRRLTSPAFTEKNNRLVWKETLAQTQVVLASWLGPGADGRCRTIRQVASDSMRLSLNVISHAGLGQRMEWPKATGDEVPEKENLSETHTMSFTFALQYLLHNLLYIMLLPKWVLSM
jgi:hypothetical protein